jgi:protein TonB
VHVRAISRGASQVLWSRSFVVSWILHGGLVAAAVYWIPQVKTVSEGERSTKEIQVARHEPVPEPKLEEQEPEPEVLDPPDQHDPTLVETPYELEPLQIPEDRPELKPLDWLAPQDPFVELRPFKQPPEPEPEPPQPELKPEPPVEPEPPVLLKGDSLPQVVKGEAPTYPAKAQRLRWEGTVLLRIQVDAAGAVIDVSVFKTSGHAVLDEAAKKAFLNWQFRPRTAGEPDVRLLEKPFSFRLGR